jgi:hypothetical protein
LAIIVGLGLWIGIVDWDCGLGPTDSTIGSHH